MNVIYGESGCSHVTLVLKGCLLSWTQCKWNGTVHLLWLWGNCWRNLCSSDAGLWWI